MAAAVSGCDKNSCFPSAPSSVKLVLAVGGEGTRTTLDAASGLSAWEHSDRIAVWAQKSDGSLEMSGQSFALVASDGPKGYFCATLAAPMADASYTYFVSYPVPEAQSGTLASFRVPAVQDGTATNGTDILIAQPAQYGALEPWAEDSPILIQNGPRVHMKHLLHFLRFYIPEGCDLLGESVEKIEFSMPQAMAGKLSVDVSDGSATLSEGSGSITLALSQPISPSAEGMYALAGIFPPARSYAAGEEMTVNLYAETKWASVTPINLRGRSFVAGHVTSVPLMPAELHDYYSLVFTLASNNLGEDVQNLTLTLQDGSNWPGTESSVYTVGGGLRIGSAIRFATPSESEFRALSGKTVVASYESDNAIVSQQLTLGDFSSGIRKDQALDCPYLFAEDFSGASTALNNNGSFSSTGHSGTTIEGTDYGLPGWTGNQIAVVEDSGNKALAIRHQNENSLFFQGTYRGRADSAPLQGIKPGHSVNVSVSFCYTGRASGKNSPQITYGWSTNASAMYGYYQGGSAAIKGGTLIENQAASLVTAPQDGTAASVNISASFGIDQASSAHRLSWDCMGTKSAYSTTQEWIIIDDIKVTITK